MVKFAKKYYITTAIDYVNAEPHIGHAYQKVIADILSRWYKLKGEEVFFLTGTDEHGQKIAESAEKEGLTPQEICDKNSEFFKKAWKSLNIEYNRFIRTTDSDHKKLVQELIKKIHENGDIYEGEYEGLYCVGCESYITEKDLVNGKCPLHNKEPKVIKEKSYFFKLSKYQEKLFEYYEKNIFVLPQERKNETINRIKEGLKDLSITRKNFSWGVEFPVGEGYVTYVWFDALINYLSGVDWPDGKNSKFWPADAHLLGKDNGWFHAVIWPAMLWSAGIEAPKDVFIHGFLTFNGQKISKSLGNAISPITLVEKYGADAIRYYLAREIIFGQDGDFSEESLVKRINNELANDLGNVVLRINILLHKFFEGKIPESSKTEKVDEDFIKKLDIFKEVNEEIDKYNINKAVEQIWTLVKELNKYLNTTEIWKTKDEGRKKTVLYTSSEALRIISILLEPFIPETTEKIKEFFNLKHENFSELGFGKLKTEHEVKKAEQLFKKIEIKEEKIFPAELKIGKILEAKEHPSADKLVVLQVDLGNEKRQLVAGIRKFYEIEELAGKNILVVTNLKPANLRGVDSNGMLLATTDKAGEIKVIEPKGAPGEIAGPEGYLLDKNEITIEQFSKIKLKVKDKKLLFNDSVIKTESNEIKVDAEDGVRVS